ncbi:MAG: hypothetical protein ABII90_11040 [Bacteroidota bacterium]
MFKSNLHPFLLLRYSIFILFLCTLYSCKKDVAPPIDMGYGYFPTEIGKWIIYDVDSTVYDGFYDTVITYQYQIKEVVESTFIDNQGRETQRIERYKRLNSSLQWIIKDVWFSNRTTSTAEKVEENVRFIKLTFPVNLGNSWDGNSFNTMDEWNYEYTEVDAPCTINTLLFDSTATVLQIYEENLIEKQYYLEKYAKNVGLIYKELIDVADNSSEIDFEKPLMTRISTGVIFTMRINSYGT